METVSRLLLTFLLNALWQVTLVAGTAALGAWMLRNGPARYRHRLWAMALGLAVLLPLSSVGQALSPSVSRAGWAKGEKRKSGKGTMVPFSPFPFSPGRNETPRNRRPPTRVCATVRVVPSGVAGRVLASPG